MHITYRSATNPCPLNPIIRTLFLLLAVTWSGSAEASPQFRIQSSGSNYRVWERIGGNRLTDVPHRQRPQSAAYIELASGMHYQQNGRWLESEQRIEPVPGGAQAVHGPLQIFFHANINTRGAIDLTGPEQNRLRSHVLGLAYTDLTTGQSVLIAEIKDSVGVLISSNQVLYPDAFTDLKADLRFTYKRASFEQDVILRERPPAPAAYGLDPESTCLEVFTEFVQPPAPIRTQLGARHLHRSNSQRGKTTLEPVDEQLQFGSIVIGRGKAFPMQPADAGHAESSRLPVRNSWEKLKGRHFLIETLDYNAIKAELNALPESAHSKSNLNKLRQVQRAPAAHRHTALSSARQFPAAPPERKQASRPMDLASSPGPRKGFVIDYLALLVDPDFTFRGDTTYLINGPLHLSGTTVIEGGSVIKCSPGTDPRLVITGPVDCQTRAYRPAIFTAQDDDSVGHIIAGSTGDPVRGGYGQYLVFDGNPSVLDLHDVRFRFGHYGIRLGAGCTVRLRHAQLGYNWAAIVNHGGRLQLQNVLIHQGAFGVAGTSSDANPAQCEHVTFHQLDTLQQSGELSLTNSLVISVTNNLTFTPRSDVVVQLDDTGVFQGAGAAAHYLADRSLRDAGTLAIDPSLIADLKQRTTFAPRSWYGNFTDHTTLRPTAQRDFGLPDLGYHYDPLDYYWTEKTLHRGIRLTLTNGVTIGIHGDSGLTLTPGSFLFSEGTPTRLNRLVHCNAVQEVPVVRVSTTDPMSLLKVTESPVGSLATIRMRFTQVSFLADSSDKQTLVQTGGTNLLASIVFEHSLLHNVHLESWAYYDRPDSMIVAFTNNLLDRVHFTFNQGYQGDVTRVGVYLLNNLVRGGSLTLHSGQQGSAWVAQDNLFHSSLLEVSGLQLVHSHNGYYDTPYLSGSDIGNVSIDVPDFLPGPLGRFYYPVTGTEEGLASLRGAGSRSASAAGLYHFTTTPNQVKTGNSTVDIGMHYSVVAGGGLASDFDADGIADYIEDSDGNGLTGLGETDWTQYDSVNALLEGELSVFTPLE